jgi:hypothetical protein
MEDFIIYRVSIDNQDLKIHQCTLPHFVEKPGGNNNPTSIQ